MYRLRHEHDAVVTGRKQSKQTIPYIRQGCQMAKSDKGDSIENGDINFEHQLFKDTTSQIWIYTENEKLKITINI